MFENGKITQFEWWKKSKISQFGKILYFCIKKIICYVCNKRCNIKLD